MRLFGSRSTGTVTGDVILQLGALRILRSLCSRQLRRTFGPLFLERIITARIQRQLPTLEVQDVIDHLVQKVALVTDHYQCCGIGLEEILQPERRFQIEVVGRFVQQQDVGFGKQERAESDAHFPSARKAFDRTFLHLFIEAQPAQYLGRARRGTVGVDRQQAVVYIAHAVHVGAGFKLFQQLRPLGSRREYDLFRRHRAAGRFLRNIANAGARRFADFALIRFNFADKRFHQRGFACAIAADQADARTNRNGRAGALENGPAAKPHCDTIDCKHARPPNSLSSFPKENTDCETCKICVVR